uniref:Bm12469 n=1 Tax=Brugia malayi TaxID=6279 RepID=A0A1I9GBF4_BRUMA|nr:Bm12469 [Brugia malayi]
MDVASIVYKGTASTRCWAPRNFQSERWYHGRSIGHCSFKTEEGLCKVDEGPGTFCDGSSSSFQYSGVALCDKRSTSDTL